MVQVVVKRPRVVLSRKDDQHSGATAARIQGLEALLRRSNPLRNINVVFDLELASACLYLLKVRERVGWWPFWQCKLGRVGGGGQSISVGRFSTYFFW